ncbi:MAG: DUF697 domain-containing protein [Fusobacteriaceae bacterium]|jgi:uncharacterized protein (DUF697 family)/GTP-binding protein EngB required for normal cell division|nr:DUF697 domain-containing protein [Fusobacteriaceae bacterium]
MKEYSVEEVQKRISEIQRENKIPGILICGQTGAGKSSVVNYIFDESVSTAGVGTPCTKGIKLYQNNTVNIYDSEGYEIGSEKQAHYEKLIFDDFLLQKKGYTEDSINIIWYTISAAGKRFTDLDISLIKKISQEGFPICVLLAKIDELDDKSLLELENELKKALPVFPIFKTSILAKNDEAVAKYCDWEKIITWTYEKLPENLKFRYVSALQECLELKRNTADNYINLASLAAAGIAASPIPFSDAALLVPLQTGLLMEICSLYGIKISNSGIFSFVLDIGVSQLGKSIAGNLIKLIPGIGTAIGTMINVTVASTITKAVGTALSEAIYIQCKKSTEGKAPVIDIEAIISSGEFIKKVIEMYKSTKV